MNPTHFAKWMVAVAWLFSASPAVASDIGQELADAVSEKSYRHFLDNELYTRLGDNRGRFGPEHTLARDNIAAIFAGFGLDVELHGFGTGTRHYNVVGTKVGFLYPERQFIVGAHFDSFDNPGADDDASGVAALLELARVLEHYETAATIKFIAFDLEEEGLVGSQAYVADHGNDDIQWMLALDIIAHDDGSRTSQIDGPFGEGSMTEDLAAAINEYGNGLSVLVRRITRRSDHHSFVRTGAEVLRLLEKGPDITCNHRPCDSVDTPGLIDYEFAADQVRSVAGFLADEVPVLEFVDCNGNGTFDVFEIAADPSLDCNYNGRLDVCEVASDQDCNNNGVPDQCEIEIGTSEDFNQNGVPDECEVPRTIYVDDDAPGDPGPGDPTISDPEEDGSLAHPYDAIQEAIDASISHDDIQLADGIYRGVGNREINPGGRSIAIHSGNGPQKCIIDCELIGGAFVFNSGESANTVVEGFTITRGPSSVRGSAVSCSNGSSPTIRNCTITESFAKSHLYGVINCQSSSPIIENCTLRQIDGFGIAFLGVGAPIVRGCTMIGCTTRIAGASVTMVDCTISGSPSQGIRVETQNDTIIANCVISGNNGGILCVRSNVLIINCTITNNIANNGGGVALQSGRLILRNCTITGNIATNEGGGVHCDRSTATITNCIIVGNQALRGSEIALVGRQIPSTLSISYSDVEGGESAVYVQSGNTLLWGAGNIDEDPLFVDPGADFHLRKGSPAIDAGDPSLLPQMGETDLDGQKRVWNARVEMGVDEFGSFVFGDLNCDGRFDGLDIDSFLLALGDPIRYQAVFPTCEILLADMNGDGRANGADIDPFFLCLGGHCP